eukprot:TRINITY_DN40559_c0_g1_i1.p1 TRINITY_DN40559_c0_g1~~TRINITY_DN40559_c0_g1_i1.p1  ORF type:complete len:381 (-),score=94.52 TRINITY_DN40559_c0_g1_i1:60-1181(-)
MAIRESPPECLSDPLLGRHLFAKINGTKYHYVESGSRRQEMILCLHDFGDFWYGWRNQLRGLSHSNWVVALDLKGSGDSEKPFIASKYKDEVIVEELKQFIDVLQENDKKIVLVGHGLGGHIAWKFIEKYPYMVSKFISISTPHPRIWLKHVMRSWRSVIENRWLYVCRLPFLPEMEMVSNDLEVFDKRFKKSSSVTDLTNYSNFDKEAYKYTFSRTADWQGPINYFRNLPLADSSVLREEGPRQSIPVEALLLVGNMDPEVSLELVSQSAEYVERFAMQIVNGAGHNPHQEQANVVNKHITKFIKVLDITEESNSDLPKARQALINYYTAPVGKIYNSSANIVNTSMKTVSNISNTLTNLPLISTYMQILNP